MRESERKEREREVKQKARIRMRCVYGLPTHVQVLYAYVCAFVHLSFDVSDVRNDQKEAGTLTTSRVGM